jgi:hypothetical protein
MIDAHRDQDVAGGKGNEKGDSRFSSPLLPVP